MGTIDQIINSVILNIDLCLIISIFNSKLEQIKMVLKFFKSIRLVKWIRNKRVIHIYILNLF